MDGEYAFYLENKDYAMGHENYCRVLIMGDSSAKDSYFPRVLSDGGDVYNFALNGASPIEEYYYLQEYLQYNDAPEYIVYTQASFRMENAEYFWNRNIYFHRMPTEAMKDILLNYDKFIDVDGMQSEEPIVQCIEYSVYSLTRYGEAVINGFFDKRRYETNFYNYYGVQSNQGRAQTGWMEYCDEIAEDVYLTNYEVNPVVEEYFFKFLELCKENDIIVIYQSAPYNECTFEEMNEGYLDEYTAHMESISEEYSNLYFEPGWMVYGPENFADPHHLNAKGAVRFSEDIKRKYSFVFSNDEDDK